MHRILVIEDDPIIRETLEYNLSTAGFEVSLAADGRQGLNKALKDDPHVILLDRLLPQMDGIAVCRELRESGNGGRIIMITALGTEADKILGLDAGADDYMTKPFSFEELLARIKAQLRRISGSAAEPPRTLSFGDVSLNPVSHQLAVNDTIIDIRPKEWQLLVALATKPGVLFSRQQLAEIVWGSDFVGSSRTIDVHVRRLREKVEKASAYNFIRTVHGLGYRFELTLKDPDGCARKAAP